MDKRSQSQIIPYNNYTVNCNLHTAETSLPTLNDKHWNHSPKDKNQYNFPLKADSLMQDQFTGTKELKLFAMIDILAISIHPTMLGHSPLKGANFIATTTIKARTFNQV